MTTFDADALLAWCLLHILCDLCGTENGEFVPDEDQFICQADKDMLRMVLRQPPQEEPPLT